jgi:hypothetical protein
VKSPLIPHGTEKIWTLIGSGAAATPVELLVGVFSDCTGASPSFATIQKATLLDELKALTVPSQRTLEKDGNELFLNVRKIIITGSMGHPAHEKFSIQIPE